MGLFPNTVLGKGLPSHSPSPAAAHQNASLGDCVSEKPLWIFNAVCYLAFAEFTIFPHHLSSICCSPATWSSTQPSPAQLRTWDQMDPKERPMGSAGRSFQTLLQNLVMQNFPEPPSRFKLDSSGVCAHGCTEQHCSPWHAETQQSSIVCSLCTGNSALVSSFLFKVLRSPKVRSGEGKWWILVWKTI